MKTLQAFCVVFIFCISLTSQSQTAEEIVENYIENIGGQESWSKIESMKVTGVGRQQGVDYPFVATYLKDGRYIIDVDLQGTSFVVEAFDGENFWSMNFQTQKAEAADSETSVNVKNQSRDEISGPFYNFKEKGYNIELLGKVAFEGSETFKIKLTKKAVLVDGNKEENSEIYYFDTENFVPVAMEAVVKSGPAKGATSQTIFSDYQEADGLYVAFSQIEKFNGNVGLEMMIKTIEFNGEVEESIFEMPED